MTDDRDIRPTAIAARTKQLIERSRELADRAKQTIAESRRLMEELRSVHPGAFSGGGACASNRGTVDLRAGARDPQ